MNDTHIIDHVGPWTIDKGDECYVVYHKNNFAEIIGSPVSIDGIFFDTHTANKALKILQDDKPMWEFSMVKSEVVNDIWKSQAND